MRVPLKYNTRPTQTHTLTLCTYVAGEEKEISPRIRKLGARAYYRSSSLRASVELTALAYCGSECMWRMKGKKLLRFMFCWLPSCAALEVIFFSYLWV